MELEPDATQRTYVTDGRTDRRTDRILIARPCLHSMQRGNQMLLRGQ